MARPDVRVLLLNDTRCDQNPGCQATMSSLVRQLTAATGSVPSTRPRGDGYQCFAEAAQADALHVPAAWQQGVDRLADSRTLADAIGAADLVVVNLEGTFHHQTIGALALGGALALAHRMGKRAWAVNGTVEGIDRWLLDAALAPCEHVAVREPRSVRWLAAHGITAAAAADCVFSLEGFLCREPSRDARPHAVLYTPGVLAAVDAVGALPRVFGDLETLAAVGWAPVFLQIEPAEEAIATAVAAAGWPVEQARDVAWNAFGSYLRQFGLLVSGRYHLLIFAAMAGVPAVALRSNTFKIDGLTEWLDGGVQLARHPDDLRGLLTTGVPDVVARATIRRCQQAAALNVMPPPQRPLVWPIEGLDWIPLDDLASTLVGLAQDGPAAFQTTIDAESSPVTAGSYLPVRPIETWRALLREAGFAIAAEDDRLPDRSMLRLSKRLEAPPLTLARFEGLVGMPVASASAGGSIEDAAPYRLFVVNGAGEFERLRARTAARRSSTFSVLVLESCGLGEDVQAWCRTRGIQLQRSHVAADVNWDRYPPDLVCEGAIGAYAVAVRHRGFAQTGADVGRPLRVALFGASSAGRAAAAGVGRLPGIELACFLDNDPATWGLVIDGQRVLEPTAAAFDHVDVVAITSMHGPAIAAQVAGAGYPHLILLDISELEATGPRVRDPGVSSGTLGSTTYLPR